MSGKGDWIPGTNVAAYSANYPTIDWNAREREAQMGMHELQGINAERPPSWAPDTDPSPEGQPK